MRNFDDVDLGIVAIVGVVTVGAALVGSLLALGVPTEKVLSGTGFIGVGIAAIGSLARGRKQ